MGSLLIWLVRWTSGERFRKATPKDYQFQFGAFFFVGVWMIAWMTLGSSFMDHGGAVRMWIVSTAAGAIMFFSIFAWARRVPARISLALAIIAWAVVVWLGVREAWR